MKEKDMERLSRAGNAKIAKDYYEATLTRRREVVISELCGMYRERKLDFPVLCGKIAELTSIEDLLSRFDHDIKQGTLLEGKLYDGHTADPSRRQ